MLFKEIIAISVPWFPWARVNSESKNTTDSTTEPILMWVLNAGKLTFASNVRSLSMAFEQANICSMVLLWRFAIVDVKFSGCEQISKHTWTSCTAGVNTSTGRCTSCHLFRLVFIFEIKNKRQIQYICLMCTKLGRDDSTVRKKIQGLQVYSMSWLIF